MSVPLYKLDVTPEMIEKIGYKHVPRIKVAKAASVGAILPSRQDALLKDIQHLQTQLGRLSECANKIYAEVLGLTIED